MNGKLIIIDTNVVLYILGGKYNVDKLPEGSYCISFITEMELLSYPLLHHDEEKNIRNFLSSIDIIEMNEIIKQNAILLRKKYNIKLPDAIICSTVYSEKGILVSNDTQLQKIEEINIFRESV